MSPAEKIYTCYRLSNLALDYLTNIEARLKLVTLYSDFTSHLLLVAFRGESFATSFSGILSIIISCALDTAPKRTFNFQVEGD